VQATHGCHNNSNRNNSSSSSFPLQQHCKQSHCSTSAFNLNKQIPWAIRTNSTARALAVSLQGTTALPGCFRREHGLQHPKQQQEQQQQQQQEQQQPSMLMPAPSAADPPAAPTQAAATPRQRAAPKATMPASCRVNGQVGEPPPWWSSLQTKVQGWQQHSSVAGRHVTPRPWSVPVNSRLLSQHLQMWHLQPSMLRLLAPALYWLKQGTSAP
jgi:hypothetical protein